MRLNQLHTRPYMHSFSSSHCPTKRKNAIQIAFEWALTSLSVHCGSIQRPKYVIIDILDVVQWGRHQIFFSFPSFGNNKPLCKWNLDDSSSSSWQCIDGLCGLRQEDAVHACRFARSPVPFFFSFLVFGWFESRVSLLSSSTFSLMISFSTKGS